MKFFYTICLFCALSSTTIFAQMSGKMCFVFDCKDSVLTFRYQGSEQSDLFINRKNNSFATLLTDLLVENNKAAVYVHDNTYCFLYYSEDGYTFTKVNWFDSIQCSDLTIRFSEFGEPGQLCPIDIKINKSLQNPTTNTGEETKGVVETVLPHYYVYILILLIMVFVVLFVIKKLRKAKIINNLEEDTDKKNDDITLPASVSRISIVDRNLVHGLDFIQDKPEYGEASSYYLLNMDENYDDTAIRYIWIHYSVVKKIYDFFTSTLETDNVNKETGCYLVGCWDNVIDDTSRFDISIEDLIEPGDDIQPDEYSFNFGLKIGMNLHKRISNLTRKTGRDFVHTVWMHSHPGLGVFLSSSDLKVQTQLANSTYPGRLAAFVIDTNTPNLSFGVFTSKKNGKMNNMEDAKELYSLETLYSWSKKENAKETANHDVMEISVASTNSNSKQNMHFESQAFADAYGDDSINNFIPEREGYYGPIYNANTPVFFSAKSINSIDSLIYDSNRETCISGYLSGIIEDGSILVESCDKDKQTNCIGYFSTCGIPTILDNHLQPKKQCLLIAYEDSIDLIVSEELTAINDINDIGTHLQLSQMKEWTRRRRGLKK